MVLAVIVAFSAAAILVALLCCGSALCWMGLHGPRVDDHLHCGACGYDLHGWRATPRQCSECGADLWDWRAIGNSQRQIQFRPIGFGIVLILSGFSPIAAAVGGL